MIKDSTKLIASEENIAYKENKFWNKKKKVEF